MLKQGKRLGAIAASLVALSSVPALTNPFLIEDQQPEQQFTLMFGARYWYGFDETSKDLNGSASDGLVSRLTHDGMQTHSRELFGRVDHINGWFWKGPSEQRGRDRGGRHVAGNLIGSECRCAADRPFPPQS